MNPFPLALALAAVAIPVTEIYDGMPPERFQKDGVATVHFVANVNTRQTCGKAPKGYFYEGCEGDDTIVITNPCHAPPNESYARILCHELGHVNGWPGTHGP